MRPSIALGTAWQLLLFITASSVALSAEDERLTWNELPSLPDELGVAGPFAGVHNNALIVAGGANFRQPVWENQKVWRNRIFVLTKSEDEFAWKDGGRLDRSMAYGACVSTEDGVVCMGGNDAENTFDRVFALQWDPETEQITQIPYPSLPNECVFGSACLVEKVIYLAGGQRGQSLESAMTNFWSLDLSRKEHTEEFVWQEMAPWPGRSRAFNLTVGQHNGFDNCVYVISGRRQEGKERSRVEFLKDVWEYSPSKDQWRKRADAPRCVMAAAGLGVGQSHIFVLGGADGSLYFQGNELQDRHPGFPKSALTYHTITDTWSGAGAIPQNQVTTIAVEWDKALIVPSGEIRPRVRSSKVWKITPIVADRNFGVLNYAVLFGYLFGMVGVGVYFSRKNKDTNDYFRGGQNMPWWAAGCSIFATMLSSMTFMSIPSKAFAQDWVYAVGNFLIPVVALIAVFVAMPFFRRIDATSAYEYLERRFSRSVRLFGSTSFALYHTFRIAVVMSLAGLALAVATPLTPSQSVVLMGVLSILYCTMGGMRAVIWSDTIQAGVLMGGALVALILLVGKVEGGLDGLFATANQSEKFNIANFHWDMTSAHLALWVVIVGGIAQNVSSYTADQAVVQRYVTTPTKELAARSIWTNAVLTIPATILFFGIGTALFVFYKAHPEKLDPTITTDQIFPLFVSQEMPVIIAGLIVAGIFAAAQSTVSTSMNSTATAIVTDFMRPYRQCSSEAGYLRAARFSTFFIGAFGTVLALVFVDPDIKSLFEVFLEVIGLFMGVLGGLFVLGACTRRANATGAMVGALVGTAFMLYLWQCTDIHLYLYTASGISTCLVVGYSVSLLTPPPKTPLQGLTIYTL